MPDHVEDSIQWLQSQRSAITTATVLMPFAGISFLWFIGVVRDGLGRNESRFFLSVFLRSGLRFLAMMFVATAGAVGLVTSNESATDPPPAPKWAPGLSRRRRPGGSGTCAWTEATSS
ncbi:hypothetical protein [Nocardia niigatensis]